MKPRFLLVTILLFALLVVVPIANANSLNSIGTPTLRAIPGANSSTVEIYADAITNGGTTGNGAIGWDVYFMVPNTVALADFTVTPGSAWVSACSGTFSTTKVSQTSVLAGKNAYLISGVCLAAQNSVITGSNVLVATLTFTSSCSATGAFNVDLSSGPANDSSDLFDTLGDVYIFPDASLTDGGSVCGPTAVTMSGMEAASNNPAPFTAAAWPALAGLGAVAAGGVYALARRKR